MLIIAPLSLASLFILIGVIVVMVSSDVVLALLALGFLPLLNVLATRFSRRMGPIGFAQQRKLGDLSGVVEETVAGIRAVKGFGAEAVQAQRLEDEADEVLDRSLEAANLRAGFLPVLDLLPAFSLVMILWYGGHQVLDGNLDVGRHPRVQPVHRDADLPSAHRGHHDRPGITRDGLCGSHRRGAPNRLGGHVARPREIARCGWR